MQALTKTQVSRKVVEQAAPAPQATKPAPEPRHFTPEQNAIVAHRMKLLAPMLHPVGSLSEASECIARENQVSTRTVWRLYGMYLSGGVDALAPKPRSDRGHSRTFANRPKLRSFVAAKWKEVPNVALIVDAVRREWGGPLLPYVDSVPPSYDSVNRFLLGIPTPLRDHARLPKQKWEARHAPYLTTGRGQYTHPNQVWIADHRIYDVLVMNDCFDGAPEHAATRLWHTCIQDMRTRVIVGSVWNVTPSWRTIASALHQGISNFGLPKIFYADNGKDFRKVGAGALHGSLIDRQGRVPFPDAQPGEVGLLARLNIKVSYCTPRHPQAKQVESYFNFVAQRFDKLFSGRGYTGPKPEMRPDYCRDAEKEHKEFLTGKREQSPLIPASYFLRLHAQFLKEYNSTWKHGGRGMNGRAPLDVMNELLPNADRRIPDMAELAPLFWDVQKRVVRNCKVELDKASYSAALDDSQGQQNLFLANGKTIAVHRDPSDMACALAFEDGPSGALLARLISDELAAQSPVTADAVKAIHRQRARLRRATKEAMDAASFGVPSEIEMLAARAELPRETAPPRRAPRRIEAVASPFVSDAVRASKFWEED